MKKLYFLCLTALIGLSSFGQTDVFVNEIHYDNASSDVDEAIEIAGPAGTDLTGWSIEKYNGSNSSSYGNESLSGTIADQENGYGTLNFIFAANALQNGAPDAIALIDNLGAVVQFLSYEGSLTAVDGPAAGMTSIDIGVAEGGTTQIGESLQLMGSGNSYEEFTWEAVAIVNTYGAVNTNQTFTTTNTPSITITSPSNGTDFAPGTTSVDVEFSTTNLSGGETVDITVNGTTTNNITSPFAVTTVDGQSYDVTIELVNGGLIDSDMVSFNVLSSNTVANIAELRAGTIGQVYTLTGEALLTYQQGFRNQKYIEDATGAVLIDDSPGTISGTFAIGDGITGLSGTLGEFGGTIQFAPIADPGAASSTGNTLTPQAVTLAMLTANPEQYESELVEVTAVTMDNSVETTFLTGTVYALTQGVDNFNFRTSFFSADYIGATVPTTATDIIGIVNERSDGYYFTARDADDFSVVLLSVDDLNANAFSVYPNPTSTGFVNVVGTNNNAISVSVYDILGKQVINESLTNNRINVSALNAGIYILKISQNDASVTKKLVIK